MRLNELYGDDKFGLSIEIFPPKSSDGDAALRQTLAELAELKPAFVSCTYGAAGSTRDRTLDWCQTIQRQFGLTSTAHFTCVGSSRTDLCNWLTQAHESGIRNIMALRGDAPADATDAAFVADGLRYANELVALIREQFDDMGIGVAGYPEKHPEASTFREDLDFLKRKVDTGADAVFTQLFFDNSAFFRFRDECDRVGITVPVIPGIMPITGYDRIKRITELCGASIPDSLRDRLESSRDDSSAQFEIGVDFAIEQCLGLMREGIPGLHLYVLNRALACQRLLTALDWDPVAAG